MSLGTRTVIGILLCHVLCCPGFHSDAYGQEGADYRAIVGPQDVPHDSGLNVLIDQAHETIFFNLWSMPPVLRQMGFRATTSHASLDTVLPPGSRGRVLVPSTGELRFARVDLRRFNVVVTFQQDRNAQDYTTEEVESLKAFVASGGGLVIIGGAPWSARERMRWPLNRLAKQFGASILGTHAVYQGNPVPDLEFSADWTPVKEADGNRPIAIRRTWGKGRIVLLSSVQIVAWSAAAPAHAPDSVQMRGGFLADLIRWTAKGSRPDASDTCLPVHLFPELEYQLGKLQVFYARNQNPEVVQALKEDVPQVKTWLSQWLGSSGTEETTCMTLVSGEGGGFATGKSVMVAAISREGLLSVFAHELSHNVLGPANDDGGAWCGQWPALFSEAHAGWFQRKTMAKLGYDCHHDELLNVGMDDPAFAQIDLASCPEGAAEWRKLFWVLQKLDDRYGTTWYPRWLWVKNTRWRDDPTRVLSWDDVVQDMSIAVGEDLFPFFRRIGTSLRTERLSEAEFQGRKLSLPIARLEVDQVGPPRLEPAGDFRQPLVFPASGRALRTPTDPQSWQAVFSQDLRSTDAYRWLRCSVGPYGGEATISAGRGIAVHGVFGNTAAWLRVPAGNRWDFGVQFMLTGETVPGFWLGGDGYGASRRQGYFLELAKEEGRLYRQGQLVGRFRYTQPLRPGEASALNLRREGSQLSVLLGERQQYSFLDMQPLEGPAYRFVAFGGCGGLAGQGVVYWNARLRVPAEVPHAAALPVDDRRGTPPVGPAPAANGRLLLEATASQMAESSEWVRLLPEQMYVRGRSLVLCGDTPALVLLQAVGVPVAFEVDFAYVTKVYPVPDTTGQIRADAYLTGGAAESGIALLVASEKGPPDASVDASRFPQLGWEIRLPDALGNRLICRLGNGREEEWTSAAGGTPEGGKPHTCRLELLHDNIRVFLDGAFVLESGCLPDEFRQESLQLYVGVKQYYDGALVRGARLYSIK